MLHISYNPYQVILWFFLVTMLMQGSYSFAWKGFRQSNSFFVRRNFSKSMLNGAPTKLPESSRSIELPRLKQHGWELVQGRDAIKKLFLFQDFTQSFTFMTNIAFKAEAMQHHPEWFNVYNRVEVTLSTHDCDGLSHLDVQLADYMDQQYLKMK